MYIFTIHSSVSLVPFDWGHWSHTYTIRRRRRRRRERGKAKKKKRKVEGKTGRYKRVGAKDIHWHFYTFLCVMLFRSWMESGPPRPSASSIHRWPPALNKKKRKFIGKTDQFSPSSFLLLASLFLPPQKNQLNCLFLFLFGIQSDDSDLNYWNGVIWQFNWMELIAIEVDWSYFIRRKRKLSSYLINIWCLLGSDSLNAVQFNKLITISSWGPYWVNIFDNRLWTCEFRVWKTRKMHYWSWRINSGINCTNKRWNHFNDYGLVPGSF